ncbi:MAG TPA: sugar phosphate isomerase/epimerase family protein [Bryobacteraceae bacterium]|nr:sugar phosphate isomerase/epimerase family protein [Bryobacteraceae bacterium]
MNRRELLKTFPALALAQGLTAEIKAVHSRLHAGVVAYSFRKRLADKTMTYEDLIHLASDSGLDGIDTTAYWFPNTSPAFVGGLRTAAYRNGIQLYSLAVRVRLCQPTAELQAAEVENCKKWVDVAERIGAGHVRVFGGAVPKGASEEQAIAWAVEVLKQSAEYAASKGIILGVEDDGGLTTTAEPTVAIVKQADTPFAGINLDIGNFPKNGYAQVALCIPYATNVHFKVDISDENGNKERADWPRLAGMFRSAGYKGFLSLEYEEAGDATTAVPPLLKELTRVV